MKPLATPVLGGMVSSLLHVLIITPVIFLWLRERELRRAIHAGRNGTMKNEAIHRRGGGLAAPFPAGGGAAADTGHGGMHGARMRGRDRGRSRHGEDGGRVVSPGRSARGRARSGSWT
jgi:hypothetical protein